MKSHDEPSTRGRGGTRPAFRAALWVLGGSAAVLLGLEHRAHLLGSLPLVLLLMVCIGAHFMMHRGHAHGGKS